MVVYGVIMKFTDQCQQNYYQKYSRIDKNKIHVSNLNCRWSSKHSHSLTTLEIDQNSVVFIHCLRARERHGNAMTQTSHNRFVFHLNDRTSSKLCSSSNVRFSSPSFHQCSRPDPAYLETGNHWLIKSTLQIWMRSAQKMCFNQIF